MDLRFLRTFVYVVELGSIAEAARYQNLTAASVQQRIRTLDASVGSQLLLRSGRTVRPTLAGRRVLELAKKILNDAHDLKAMACDTDLPAGPLRLGATPTAIIGMVPETLKRWFSNHPDVEVYIEPGSSKALYARLMERALDAAILVHPQFEFPKHYAWQEIRTEPLRLVTPFALSVTDPLEVVSTHPYICYDRSAMGGKLADDYLRACGVRPRIRLELDGINSIERLVAEGLGVSILPDTGTLHVGPNGVAIWPLLAPAPTRSVGILWERNAARAALAAAFGQMIGQD